MKLLLFTVALCSFSAMANDVYVNDYTRNNGTYVQPHYQTAPNNTKFDNYSTRGNVNPYTGQAGTVNPYQPKPSSYGNFNNSGFNR